ncbi:ATP-binding protein [Mycobacterium paraense]|uniref:AlbA family DNA-binding domain-containing protein n=1 Tax=Mycobacterium paraense TaxID=767916 RepID=UPI000A150E7E|nr:ATP-binding protein [Mycobacterium paraense]MCV7441233.1 ATP-binding protein [Mycobacterium paraense]ORW48952.1 transcriptional regulator [Mycobacterium paraense]
MTFTPLHRSLGLPPSKLTDEILDAAVDAGVMETDDLDWKSALPPMKGLPQTDVPKDIAAMANSGGGMIVYGVEEDQKAATRRKDTGNFSEGHERAFRSAAITAIKPPVSGLEIYRLGTNPRAVAVVVPASVDRPHLIYRNDFFGAPIRNNADTVWMQERQIETMYRARFDEQRRSNEAIESLYAETAAGRDSANRAWLIAVAHPRIPGTLGRSTRDQAREIFKHAAAITLTYSTRSGIHPIENVDQLNPRPGLRRWIAPNSAAGDSSRWREAWVASHHDGSVTLAAAIGGHRKSANGYFEGWEVEARGIEAAVADFTALIRATAAALNYGEYDVCVGVEWTGEQALRVLTVDGQGYTYDGVSTPLSTFTPVRSTIDAAAPDAEFHQQVFELAQDCVNQGGITYLHVITEPAPAEA